MPKKHYGSTIALQSKTVAVSTYTRVARCV